MAGTALAVGVRVRADHVAGNLQAEKSQLG